MPAVQFSKTVHSQDEDEHFIGKLAAQRCQGLDGVGRPVTLEFTGVHLQIAFVLHGRRQKLQTPAHIGAGRITQTRIGSGQQAYAVEAKLLAYFQSEP